MKTLILALALSLTGCAAGTYQVDRDAMKHTKLAFIGVPSVLGIGMMGTTTPITALLSLTNKHVAYPTLRRIQATHGACDIALIKQDNRGEELPKGFATAHIGQRVTMYGYSGRSVLPVSSSGVVKSFGRDGGCMVAATDAGSVQGMSGGGVFNDAGQLVGIFYALEPFGDTSYFIPMQSFMPWLQPLIH